MQRRLNRPFAFALLAVLGAAAIGVHVLHEVQARRHADVWLHQADRAREKGNVGQSLGYLAHYLSYHPKDWGMRARYGLLLESSATSPRRRREAQTVLEEVLVNNPQRHDVRQRLAINAMRLGRLAEAKDHLHILVRSAPREAEYAALLGRCLAVDGEFERAATWYRTAIQLDPARLEDHVYLSNLLRYRLDSPAEAKAALDQMVAANAQVPRAYLIRAGSARQEGALTRALSDVERARQLDRTDPQVILLAAELAPGTGRLREAIGWTGEALQAHPRHAGLHIALADLQFRDGRADAAVVGLRNALEAIPGNIDLLQALCDLLIRRGEVAEAEKVIARVRRSGGSFSRARYWEARLLMHQRRWPQAASILAAGDTANADVSFALAHCFEALHEPERAIEAYWRVLESGMIHAEASTRLARLLVERRRFVEADYVFRRLHRQTPLVGAQAQLAAEVALRCHDPARAVELAQRGVGPSARNFRDHIWLAHLLEGANRPAAAEQTLRAAVADSPRVPDGWVALIQILMRRGKRCDAHQVFEHMRQSVPPALQAEARADAYEAMGQIEQAEEEYANALRASGDDFLLLRKAATFLLRTRKPDQATPLLRRLMATRADAPREHVAWARRELARLLVGDGTQRSFERALLLLDRNRAELGDQIDDRLVRARVLATRPKRRAETLQILTESARQQALPADDEYLLAVLLAETGNLPQAREHLLNLLAVYGDNPLYLAGHVRTLLRSGEVSEARRWFARLERVDPSSADTRKLQAELQARGHAE